MTLVDRLVHRSKILEIDGASYRLEEAKGALHNDGFDLHGRVAMSAYQDVQ